jgi:uncharacterized repeat protein (TIGR01451 family)
MKKSTLLLFFVLFVYSLHGQTITFTDPAFKAKLLASGTDNFIARDLNGDYFSIDANANNEIEIAEAQQVGFLEIENSSISSLDEINNFTNLIFLNCEGNTITSLNVSGLTILTTLNCSNNQLNILTVNGLTELQNLNCQFNQLTSLDAGGITNLLNLNCSYNQIVNLNLSNLLNLEVLNCDNNALTTFDLSDLVSLKSLNCSYNQLSSINSSTVISLETLDCNSNLITSLTIDGLLNFNNLNCSNNQLTSLILINLSALTELNCNFNQLTLINFNDLINLKNINCTNNQLISLNLGGLTQLENLNCANNLIATIDLIGLNQLISLNCNTNHLASLDVSTLIYLKYLYCEYNSITALNVNELNDLLVISCFNDQIQALNLTGTNNLQSLYCSDNQISTLNLSGLPNLQNLFCANNDLGSLFIKNGSFENNLQFSGNPNIAFICADDSQIDFVQEEINNNNYTNCHVNSYCSFVPGGVSYTVQGNVKLDSNTNGCDVLDTIYPNLQFSFSDGTVTENDIANASGNYSKSLKSGSYAITPVLENPNYFSVSPSALAVDFPQAASPFSQNFCITANGNHSDVEIAILPLDNAIPGLDAHYKIIYKNKGTVMQSGTVTLNFNDTHLNFLQSNPSITSQNTNNLNWSFTNLNPLEARAILVNFSVNSASDPFPVNVAQILPFTASVTTLGTDEFPNDNTINLNQTVVGSAVANDKVCLEGSSVSTAQVGEYVHYIIRFKNSGTTVAQNIVVKDIIDTTKYDFTTLKPLDGSHAFETRLSNLNTVEFVFENINLAFGNTNSDGYVMFKIKTLPSLSIGDIFSNTASLYFDYKAPVSTNTASTIIQALENQTFESSQNFVAYPNPVNEVLNLYSSDSITVNAIAIYNSLGQLMKIITNPGNSINISQLKQGIYFINISTENGISSVKFIKE